MNKTEQENPTKNHSHSFSKKKVFLFWYVKSDFKTAQKTPKNDLLRKFSFSFYLAKTAFLFWYVKSGFEATSIVASISFFATI
jgi:hypothetical protein